MNKGCRLTVDKAGLRLDKYVVERCPDLSRTYIQKLITQGLITVNDQPTRPAVKLEAGDIVDITMPPHSPSPITAEEIPLKIVYEDNDLLVIDKPAGLTTHPAPGYAEHTLVNAILSHIPDLAQFGGSMRPGIVHRLDKDTSGLLIIAKNLSAQANLIEQFKKYEVSKLYLALVKGHLTPERGIIEAAIGRHPADRKRMAVVAHGKEARSEYRVLKYFDSYTLLEVKLETGRTHQIRVHLAAIGFPVVGDATYGFKVPFLNRQFLHAYKLSFKLPSSGEYVEFKSELPEDLKKALEEIGEKGEGW